MAQERPVDPDTAPQPDRPAPPPDEVPEAPEVPEPKRDHPQQRPRDPVTGKFEKPDTEYSRAQKEEIRKERTWQNMQAEKEQIRQEKAQWEEQRRMEQLEQARQQYQPLKKDGLTAQEYYDGAQVFEREGDHENALKAYKVASEMSQVEQQRYQQFQTLDKEYQWRMQLQKVQEIAPQAFDPSTPIGAHVQRIVNGNPGLYDLPGGFLRAAEFPHMLVQVEQLKEKDDRILELEAMVEKMQRKGQPSKGGYAAPRYGEKEFDDMDLNEMEAHLKHVTSDADNYR
jgi:hypothetical protein